MSDRPTSRGLTEGEGRGEARHKRTLSGGSEAPALDRPVRGQGESFAYSRFVEESRAADDVAEMAKAEVSLECTTVLHSTVHFHFCYSPTTQLFLIPQ